MNIMCNPQITIKETCCLLYPAKFISITQVKKKETGQIQSPFLCPNL